MKYVIGFDVGTSALKTILMNSDGNIKLILNYEYYTKTSHEGSSEQDSNDWYSATINTLRDIREKHNINLKDIISISVTGQMRGLTLLDKNSELVCDTILWNDSRCNDKVDEIKQKYGKLIQNITNTKLDTTCTLPKILWLIDNYKDSWDKTYKFINPTSFINYKLTGKICMEKNNASGTSLYDVVKKDNWSNELIELFGLDKNKFPDLVNSFTTIGKVKKQASRETGLQEGTPVIASGGDSAVETFSIGIKNSSEIKIRLGSAGDISSIFSPEEILGKPNYFCFKYITNDVLFGGTFIRSCAQAIKWVRGVFYSEYPPYNEVYNIMDKEASTVNVGSEEIIFHPFLLGEGAPYLNPHLRAMFHGLNINHKRKHIVRAAYEGVCLSLKNATDSIMALHKFEKIFVLGGGTKSDLWLSILVDVIGKSITVPKYCDAAYGAALIAGEGIDLWKSKEIIEKHSINNRILSPDSSNNKKYNKLFEKFKKQAECKACL